MEKNGCTNYFVVFCSRVIQVHFYHFTENDPIATSYGNSHHLIPSLSLFCNSHKFQIPAYLIIPLWLGKTDCKPPVDCNCLVLPLEMFSDINAI